MLKCVHDVGGGVFCLCVLGFGVQECASLSGNVLLCTRVFIKLCNG